MKRYFYIIESCMRPKGAYSEIQKTFDSEEKARKFFCTAFYAGPGYGIQHSKSLQLICRNADGSHEVLEERKIE